MKILFQTALSFALVVAAQIFEYADLTVSRTPLTFTTKDTDKRAGIEAPQLYLVSPKSDAARPRLMLRGFERVTMQPGEFKQVSFVVPGEKLALWNTDAKRFGVQPGERSAKVGAAYSGIRLQIRSAR